MTKQEAIQAMMQGTKVTHRYFQPNEWITMRGKFTIVTEEGYKVDADEFWSYRKTESWENDWSVWEE